jgi:hypothetical protein
MGKFMKTSDVIRAMRPYQRAVAPLIIDDVLSGNVPSSVDEVISRHADKIGEAFDFDTGKDWAGDVRSAAIWALIGNGFAKGKVVRLNKDGSLASWSRSRLELEAAAAIELQFGGNRSLAVEAKKMVEQAIVHGSGERAVYVYTDSRLDRLGDSCSKIGRHHRSGEGEVLQRILRQYSTGNPGYPVLRIIARTDDDVSMETFLHSRFKNKKINEGTGKEWFEVSYTDVLLAIKDYRSE